ncbi:MAG TPA: YoaK family protein [Myxococcaceae bacterium]|nr:YoaK family protein [Myxococcaceae bacterium]
MTDDLPRPGDLGLLVLLSVIAGMVDVIGFLRLDHVFAAHVMGNLVLLLARVVGAGSAPLAQLLAIPVFTLTVAAAYLIAGRSGPSRGRARLLAAQALLLLLVLGLALQPRGRPSSVVVVSAMAAVAAMAFQNALIRVALHASWTTSVTTGNVATSIVGLVGLLRPVPWTREESLQALRATLPLVLGFMAGCLMGAAGASRLGPWAWSIPAALSMVAVAGGARATGATAPDSPRVTTRT